MTVKDFLSRRIRDVRRSLAEVSLRFPVTLLFSFALCALFLWQNHAGPLPEAVRKVLERIESAFGEKVFRTTIGRTVKFPDASVAGQPITAFAASSTGAQAYRQLAREVLSR